MDRWNSLKQTMQEVVGIPQMYQLQDTTAALRLRSSNKIRLAMKIIIIKKRICIHFFSFGGCSIHSNIYVLWVSTSSVLLVAKYTTKFTIHLLTLCVFHFVPDRQCTVHQSCFAACDRLGSAWQSNNSLCDSEYLCFSYQQMYIWPVKDIEKDNTASQQIADIVLLMSCEVFFNNSMASKFKLHILVNTHAKINK